LIGAVLVVWMIVRWRMAAYRPPDPGAYPAGMAAGAGPMGVPPGGYPPGADPPGYAPGYPQTGSGIPGDLASGVAIGAGAAAGEALVRHMLPGSGGGVLVPEAAAAPAIDPQANADGGGNDFGLNDPGSWDEGSGGAGWDGGRT
jgi:hypothetical protein